MPPAARIGDMHVCPMVTVLVPHVGGPIAMACMTVLTMKMPQAQATNMCVCVGPPDMIAMGSSTVLAGKLPAARLGDPSVHGGVVLGMGVTVMIGG
ncbi:MAG: PAAR domain-containing protein [Paracoccaceae bacterium]